MNRNSASIALILALAAMPAAAAPPLGVLVTPPGMTGSPAPLLPTNEQITVATEPTSNEGLSDVEAVCQIDGGTFYIDRNYAGPIPYTGSLAPGSHYFELDLPGYDPLGIWLTLDEKTKYTISFNPEQNTPLFATNDRVAVTNAPTLGAGIASYQIFCDIGGGELYIDQIDVGTVPTANIPFTGSLPPGSHFFELELSGYRNLGFWLNLEEKTQYTITLKPERITGYISINVEPKDAAVTVDGSVPGAGTLEVPVGSHRVLVRRFGFMEQQMAFEVTDKATYYVRISLAKAPFAITRLGFDRQAFNPLNAGTRGQVNLKFEASNYGSAHAEIRGPDGAPVATLDFPNIDTWAQSRPWKGLGPDGKPLPDGVYSVVLTATPAPGVPAQEAGPDGGSTLSAETEIDSTLVIRTIGTASAIPGLVYMPDPITQPAGTVAAEASWFAPFGNLQSSAFGLSAAISVAGVATIAADAAVETGSDAGADLAGSALITIFGDRTTLLGGAFFLKGGYSSAPAPSLPGAGSAIEASLPLSLRLGDFSLALSPGALLDLSSSSPSVLGLARAGLWTEGGSFRAGVSGELPLAFSGALPSPSWPAQLALEGRLMLGSTPFVASGYLDVELEPGTSPAFGLGLGLGLLF
jgi:hypothetical protein